MEPDYTIFPAETLATSTTTLFAGIADNILVIVGVIALGVGVAFVTRHFAKAHNKIKA